MIYTVWIRINFGITVIEESPTVRLKEKWSQILTFIHIMNCRWNTHAYTFWQHRTVIKVWNRRRTYEAACAASSRCSRYASRSRPKWTRNAFRSDLRMRANCFSAIARSKLTLFLGPLLWVMKKKWREWEIRRNEKLVQVSTAIWLVHYMKMMTPFNSEIVQSVAILWAATFLNIKTMTGENKRFSLL